MFGLPIPGHAVLQWAPYATCDAPPVSHVGPVARRPPVKFDERSVVRIASLESDLSTLSASYLTLDKELAKEKKVRVTYKAEVEKLRRQLCDSRSERKSMLSELEEQTAKIERLRKSRIACAPKPHAGAVSASCDRFQGFGVPQDVASSMRSEIERLRSEIESLEATLRLKSKTLEQAFAELGENAEAISCLQVEVDEWKLKHQASEHVCDELRDRVSALLAAQKTETAKARPISSSLTTSTRLLTAFNRAKPRRALFLRSHVLASVNGPIRHDRCSSPLPMSLAQEQSASSAVVMEVPELDGCVPPTDAVSNYDFDDLPACDENRNAFSELNSLRNSATMFEKSRAFDCRNRAPSETQFSRISDNSAIFSSISVVPQNLTPEESISRALALALKRRREAGAARNASPQLQSSLKPRLGCVGFV